MSDVDRCKRSGTKWRCPKKSLPGKTYCEKHHQYNVSRNNSRKNKLISSAAEKCGTTTAAASAEVELEPYRPVIDFSLVGEVSSVSGSGCGGGGGVMDWLLGEMNESSCGNDYFTLPELGVGEGIFGSFGSIDDHGLRIVSFEERGNGKLTLGEPNGVGSTAQLGSSENNNYTFEEFSKTNMCILPSTLNTRFSENKELSCNENTVVMGVEAKPSLIRGEEMVDELQNRKKRRSIESKTTSGEVSLE